MDNSKALKGFWAALNFENMKANCGIDAVDAHANAMNDTEYYPIDTKNCMVRAEGIWFLLVASGSVITNVIECGDMGSVMDGAK